MIGNIGIEEEHIDILNNISKFHFNFNEKDFLEFVKNYIEEYNNQIKSKALKNTPETPESNTAPTEKKVGGRPRKFNEEELLIAVKGYVKSFKRPELIVKARVVKYFQDKNINLISLSGTLNRETLSFVGATSISTIKNFNMSKAFMATTGFSILNGVTNSSPLEFDIKRTVISKSSKIILLADSSKFNSVSLMTYCDLEDIDILITDKMPDKEIKDYLFNKKISIEIA